MGVADLIAPPALLFRPFTGDGIGIAAGNGIGIAAGNGIGIALQWLERTCGTFRTLRAFCWRCFRLLRVLRLECLLRAHTKFPPLAITEPSLQPTMTGLHEIRGLFELGSVRKYFNSTYFAAASRACTRGLERKLSRVGASHAMVSEYPASSALINQLAAVSGCPSWS